ncbi:MAG: 16S rRNA (uracil(1498)-N(3))-methyltransferase, partial [Micrococcales bacterium]|nr:16S rRNA (uracil(1498)-N(3))-methyltransferase [Micrococcales bacterium]
MTEPVFLTVLGAQLGAGQLVVLEGSEGHHGAKAFRLRAGEVIDVVNGAGLRARATVEVTGESKVQVLVDQVTHEPPPRWPIWLVQALVKHKRDEQAISAAVELGVDRIIPWQADRSVVRWPPERAAAGQARWAALAKAATKVARRAYLPPVEPVATTDQLIQRLAGGGAQAVTVVVLHEAASQSLPSWYQTWRAKAQARVETPLVVMVGPEGGISEAELEALEIQLGAAKVTIGPNVLRSSTAGPAAIAALS